MGLAEGASSKELTESHVKKRVVSMFFLGSSRSSKNRRGEKPSKFCELRGPGRDWRWDNRECLELYGGVRTLYSQVRSITSDLRSEY